jgi:hypothetical protein
VGGFPDVGWPGPETRRRLLKQAKRTRRTAGIPSAGTPDLTIAAIAVLVLSVAGPLQAPLDTLVDVGGYHLHMVVYRGTRPLTIVMESGWSSSIP